MSITTPQGENIRENLLAREGIDEEVLRQLDTETKAYARLYLGILSGEIRSLEGVTPGNQRYMTEYLPAKDEFTRCIPERLMPVDVVSEGRTIAENDAYVLRQYMNCLLMACVRRAVMNGHLDDLDEAELTEGLDQTCSLEPHDNSVSGYYSAIYAKLDDVSDILDRVEVVPGSTAKNAVAFALEHDHYAEMSLYEGLLLRQRTKITKRDRGLRQGLPITTMGVSNMRNRQRPARRFGVMRQTDGLPEIIKAGASALMNDWIVKGRADHLPEADATRYIEGVPPWQVVAEFYKVTNRPEIVGILQDVFRDTLLGRASHVVSQQWRPKDELDDWGDDD